MKRKTWLALLAALAGMTPAAADGGFVWRRGADLNEPEQKAIILWDRGRETLVLQVKYEGSADDFGWIVPLPGRPEVSALPPDESPFPEISFFTQRRLRNYSGVDAALRVERKLEVLERKTAGVYDVAILAASDPRALAGWLDRNGFSFPAARAAVLAHYTRKGWFFVAMRIDPRALGRPEIARLRKGELQPVRFEFDSAEPVYPLHISSVNAGPTKVLLFVLGERPLGPRGADAGRHFADHAVADMANAHATVGSAALPVTWKALRLPPAATRFLGRYSGTYTKSEMTDDLSFVPIDLVARWRSVIDASRTGYVGRVDSAVAALLALDPAQAARLVAHPNADVRRAVAASGTVEPRMLVVLAHDTDPAVRARVAANPATPIDVLWGMAQRAGSSERWGIARETVRPEALAFLAEDPDPAVRAAVAANGAATIPVLQRLARDPDRRVRLCVAQNAHTTFLILAELEQDPDPAVSWAALKGLTPR